MYDHRPRKAQLLMVHPAKRSQSYCSALDPSFPRVVDISHIFVSLAILPALSTLPCEIYAEICSSLLRLDLSIRSSGWIIESCALKGGTGGGRGRGSSKIFCDRD